jgi:hypothetical protein
MAARGVLRPAIAAVFGLPPSGVRRECVDHILVVDERQARRVLAEYVAHFNEGRPHQALGQLTPTSVGDPTHHRPTDAAQRVIAVPVLGRLHHEHRRVA